MEYLCLSEHSPSEPLETPRWRNNQCLEWVQSVALHVALQLLLYYLFPFCQSSILNDHSSIVDNCDHTLEGIHCVSACIGIAMWWVMPGKSLLAFFLSARKTQFFLYQLYTLFHVNRSIRLLTIHCLFCQPSRAMEGCRSCNLQLNAMCCIHVTLP